jgi:hypothetical protein
MVSNIHRYYVPDAIVFITQVVAHRTPVFGDADHVVCCATSCTK